MAAQACHRLRYAAARIVGNTAPAFPADHHQIDILPRLPKPGERLDGLQMTLARLNGANHQETGPRFDSAQHAFGVLRQPFGRDRVFDVRAQMKPVNAERSRPVQVLARYPCR